MDIMNTNLNPAFRLLDAEMQQIDSQLSSYRNAYDISFALGIPNHYTYYRERILQLLKQKCSLCEQRFTLRVLELLNVNAGYNNGAILIA